MDEEGYFRSIENDYLEVSNQIKTLLPQLDAQRGGTVVFFRAKTKSRIIYGADPTHNCICVRFANLKSFNR